MITEILFLLISSGKQENTGCVSMRTPVIQHNLDSVQVLASCLWETPAVFLGTVAIRAD